MRAIAEFFKNAILGGLLVIVPLLLVWGVFAQSIATVGRLAAPILRLAPKALISDTPEHRSILAVLLLILLSFLLGALLRAALFKRLFAWIEHRSLELLPGYSVLKNLLSEAARPESFGGFRPAMIVFAEGIQRPAYVIEDCHDGNFTVFLPSSPAPFSGIVHVVSADRVVFLDVTLPELARCIAQYGAGQSALLRRKSVAPALPSSPQNRSGD
ncbi:hypothetical protein [Methylocystis heyeri]|uniref:DUF502 domain-containing protein n=1 Tax=Methylocystis heyeri TaxID=391905 RepID=A0A6B8KFS7_9HYPH|nr:hypothetical protein [Methylocystis heyeri]QGM45851.1 hypothetical protein H2LOC_009130 [Methylocystis heyeri]